MKTCKNCGAPCGGKRNTTCTHYTVNTAARDEARFWRLVAKNGGGCEYYDYAVVPPWLANIANKNLMYGKSRLSAIRAALLEYYKSKQGESK